MTLRDFLIAEFDAEAASTRAMIGRAPDRSFDWQPHAKSMTLGALVTHLSLIPRWGRAILTREGYDFVRDAGPGPEPHRSLAAALAAFDMNLADVRREFESKADAELTAIWTLSRDDRVLMTMPRVTAWRRMFLNHLIHHRGQLSVYLRLLDVPVPPTYGPTADES